MAAADKIKLFATDVDGVLTPATTIFGPDGPLGKIFSVRDGFGCELLRESGVVVEFLSRERSAITDARAKWLGTAVHAGIIDKGSFLQRRLIELGISRQHLAYMGDDVFDLEALQLAGWSFAPADAHPSVLKVVKVVTSKRGGEGAFREAVDYLCEAGLV
jgi:3-deoxy-D-manno-octulosonate 8-phosphate phosphatase (KDO 8-P phosphatase)